MSARWRTALSAVVTSMLLTGCQFNGLADVQLPGGAAADDDAYHVTVDFQDVLDLVPQSSVKVNNVTVGAVEKVELHGWRARVRLRIDRSVNLPRNAVAEVRQTSILGEKYVSLAKPTNAPPVGKLTDGAKIPVSRSNRTPEIEEVLSALSALLNGGGVAQLQTINRELNNALEGREDRVKNLLSELDGFIGDLDGQRAEIIRAMEGMDKLSRKLRQEKSTIGQAVDTMPPALKVLADQRRDLTRMLRALSQLSTVGTKVINASRDDTIADLRSLQPILARLNEAGSDLPNALELMTTYPFPRNATNAVKGDYTNLYITADLDLKSIYSNITPDKPKKPRSPGLPDKPVPGLPDTPDLPDVPLPHDSPSDGGGGALCPPVCTGSGIAYHPGNGGSGYPDGADPALAELMTGGMQP